MTDGKPGVKTALELAQPGAVRQARVDGDMIEGLTTSLLPTTGVETITGANGVREPGRPKGARNKRTLAWLAYLEKRYRNPLQVLSETYSRPVAVLAQELNCTPLEAAQLQQHAAIAALPFWNQKLPQAIELELTDNTGEQRTDAQILARIQQLAEQTGVKIALPKVIENAKEKQ